MTYVPDQIFEIGQRKRIRTTLTAAGVLTDATNVRFQIRHWLADTWTDYMFEYPLDLDDDTPAGVGAGLLKREARGIYYVDWLMQLSGRHYYRLLGEGSLDYAKEGSFYVRRSEVLQA